MRKMLSLFAIVIFVSMNFIHLASEEPPTPYSQVDLTGGFYKPKTDHFEITLAFTSYSHATNVSYTMDNDFRNETTVHVRRNLMGHTYTLKELNLSYGYHVIDVYDHVRGEHESAGFFLQYWFEDLVVSMDDEISIGLVWGFCIE